MKIKEFTKNLIFRLDFSEYIKYIAFYGKEKEQNGQTATERKRQKDSPCNTQAQAITTERA